MLLEFNQPSAVRIRGFLKDMDTHSFIAAGWAAGNYMTTSQRDQEEALILCLKFLTKLRFCLRRITTPVTPPRLP